MHSTDHADVQSASKLPGIGKGWCLFVHPLPSTLKAVAGSLVHVSGVYLFVLLLLNYIKVSMWLLGVGCTARHLLWVPKLSSSQCAVAPYASSWTLSAYPLWWCVWRPARVVLSYINLGLLNIGLLVYTVKYGRAFWDWDCIVSYRDILCSICIVSYPSFFPHGRIVPSL